MPGRKRVAITTWETGTREPSLASLARLAGVFNRGVEDLLGLPKRAVSTPKRLSELIPHLEVLEPACQEALKDIVKDFGEGSGEGSGEGPDVGSGEGSEEGSDVGIDVG
jgi:transcriptional regulator with XRE-family HTH domain